MIIKFKYINLSVFIISLLLSFSSEVLLAEKPPKSSFSEDEWDFGTINQGDKVSHVFMVTNIGGSVLNITKVRSSCGCTAAVLSKRVLKNSEKGEIKATFNSKNRSGPFKKKIFVHSNDPKTPLKILSVKGNIVNKQQLYMTFIPGSWNVGTVQKGVTINKKIKILNTGFKDLRILSIKTSENIVAENESSKTVKPGMMAKINLTLAVPNKLGRINEKVIFYTDIPDLPTVKFFIRGYVKTEKGINWPFVINKKQQKDK